MAHLIAGKMAPEKSYIQPVYLRMDLEVQEPGALVAKSACLQTATTSTGHSVDAADVS